MTDRGYAHTYIHSSLIPIIYAPLAADKSMAKEMKK